MISVVVAQSRLTLCNPMDCSLPGSARGIFQARTLEWVAISFSRGPSRPREWTCISYVFCIGRWVLYHWATNVGSPTCYCICDQIITNTRLKKGSLEPKLKSKLTTVNQKQRCSGYFFLCYHKLICSQVNLFLRE